MATTASRPLAESLSIQNDDQRLSSDELWTRIAKPYQDSMGQCTLNSAREIVALMNEHKPITASSHVLDNGCGGGSIVRVLKAAYPDCRATATDISQGMVSSVAALNLPGVTAQVSDAVTLDGLDDNTFTHVATSAMVQFTPDAAATLRSMLRILQPDGLAVVAIWGPVLDMAEVHYKACKAAHPGYVPRAPVAKGAWSSPEEHEAQMKKAGFRDVRVVTVKVKFPVENAEAFVRWWSEGQNPVCDTMIADFVSKGGDMEKAKVEGERITREDYDDGKEMYNEVVIGIGRK